VGLKVVWLGEALGSTFLNLKLALKQNQFILTLLSGDEKHHTKTTLKQEHTLILQRPARNKSDCTTVRKKLLRIIP